MEDPRSYVPNISRCKGKAWKMQAWTGFEHDSVNTGAVLDFQYGVSFDFCNTFIAKIKTIILSGK